MGSAPDREAIALLLRRAGFGPTAAEIEAAGAKGYEATVEDLLSFGGTDPADAIAPPKLEPVSRKRDAALRSQEAADLLALQLWWLHRMSATSHPLREKLTLFWHGHFATAISKVREPALMYRQNQLFRSAGAGDFETLTQAVAKDPAMMIWLDTQTDKKAHPNENFARELMELFTLGIGNYTEQDVQQGARAFTGWAIDPVTYEWALQPRHHDDGIKTFLGQSGNFGGEDIVHIVTNAPAGQAFIVASVWSHFAYPVGPTDPVVRGLVPRYATDRNIANLLRAVFLHPQFVSAQTLSGLVKQPVEWLVGSMRLLGLQPSSRPVVTALADLGQIPFDPPNVGGWPQNEYWLTTASSMARLTVATRLAEVADLSALDGHQGSDRVDALGQLFGVSWSPQTAAALATADAPKLLTALGLCAPEFVVA